MSWKSLLAPSGLVMAMLQRSSSTALVAEDCVLLAFEFITCALSGNLCARSNIRKVPVVRDGDYFCTGAIGLLEYHRAEMVNSLSRDTLQFCILGV